MEEEIVILTEPELKKIGKKKYNKEEQSERSSFKDHYRAHVADSHVNYIVIDIGQRKVVTQDLSLTYERQHFAVFNYRQAIIALRQIRPTLPTSRFVIASLNPREEIKHFLLTHPFVSRNAIEQELQMSPSSITRLTKEGTPVLAPKYIAKLLKIITYYGAIKHHAYTYYGAQTYKKKRRPKRNAQQTAVAQQPHDGNLPQDQQNTPAPDSGQPAA